MGKVENEELWRRIAPSVDDGLLKYKVTEREF
jgi:hypothetical protein